MSDEKYPIGSLAASLEATSEYIDFLQKEISILEDKLSRARKYLEKVEKERDYYQKKYLEQQEIGSIPSIKVGLDTFLLKRFRKEQEEKNA